MELGDTLDWLSDDIFRYHVCPDRNDFSNWVRDVYRLTDLADELLTYDRRTMQAKVYRYMIRELMK